jgi:hypothetical protein
LGIISATGGSAFLAGVQLETIKIERKTMAYTKSVRTCQVLDVDFFINTSFYIIVPNTRFYHWSI